MALANAATAVSTAVDQLLLAELDTAPVDVKAVLKTLKIAGSKLDAKIAAITHAADASGAFIGTGSRDTAEWLAKETGTSVGRNRNAAVLGQAMAKSGDLAAAISAGTISTDKANVVVVAAADETVSAELLDTVAELPINAVKPAVEQWRARQHPNREADVAASQKARRHLRFTGQADGMTRVEGLLDPQSATHVRTTLDAVTSQSAFDDTGRSRDQRSADALTQLCIAEAKGDITGGRSNAGLLVTARYETVVERATARGTTSLGTTLDASSVRQLACDAGMHRVITGPGSSILDFGHETRLVSSNMFSALVVRDQHCRWPGCTMRATWCDTHHIIEWAQGGATNLANAALFCHHHHHMSHQPGWTLTGTGNRIEIHHPDGSIEISKPPSVQPPCVGPIDRPSQPEPARQPAQLVFA
jgi:hypothetical protein